MSKINAWSIIVFNLMLVIIWGLMDYFCWPVGLSFFMFQVTILFVVNLHENFIDKIIDSLSRESS